MKQISEKKLEGETRGVIAAVPNDWLWRPLLEKVSRWEWDCQRVMRLQDIFRLIRPEVEQILLIDMYAYRRQSRQVLDRLKREFPHLPIVCLLSANEMVFRRHLKDQGFAYLVEKEKINSRLLPMLSQVWLDQRLSKATPLSVEPIEPEEAELRNNTAEDSLSKKVGRRSFLSVNPEEAELMNKTTDGFFTKKVGRRSFIKGSATAAAAAGIALAGPDKVMKALVAEGMSQNTGSVEQTFIGSCRSNCNFGCSLRAHVRDGVMNKVSISSFPEDNYTSVCLKGLSQVQRTYSPHRVKHPLKRVGERGAGEWKQITWEEAIKEIGERFGAIRDTYGGRAIVVDTASGNYATINGVGGLANRLGNCLGATRAGNCYDVAAGHGVNRVIACADWMYSNEPTALLDAKVIIIWGTNPVFTAPHVWRHIQMAKEKGTKIICIDPVCTATAHKSDEYIPVVPGSDAYVVLAMSNYIMEHQLLDLKFLKNRSTGPFLVRRDNGELLRERQEGTDLGEYYVWDSVTGSACLLSQAQDVALEGSFTVNGIEVDTCFTVLKKHLQQYTLADAAEASGIPEDKIVYLAKTYATEGPVTMNVTYGIDHYRNGHLFFHAAAIMASLTGNLGKPGAGFSGVFVQAPPLNTLGFLFPKEGALPTKSIAAGHLYNVWKDQALFDKPYPLKGMITACSNPMSNYAEQDRWFSDVLPNMDFWVVIDTELTDSARHADIVLPCAFWFEVNDHRNIYNSPYFSIIEKAIEPLYESKPDYEIFSLIGNALGYEKAFPKEYTDTDWAKLALDSDGMRALGITWESLQEKKIIRAIGKEGTPVVRGGNGKFSTPHGRAQLYWDKPATRLDYGQEVPELAKERLPYFRPPGEAWKTNPLYGKYPLVFLQEHSRFRVHSQWYSVPLLRELDPEPVAKMSRQDAVSRGIQNGDLVKVFNDRGYAVVKAVIDDSISTGVITIPKGWQRHQFIEGCYQELTNTALDPMAVAFAYYDTLVNVEKWQQ